MAPQRKSDFSQIVLRALCTGACVSLVNACVAGESLPGRAPISCWAGLWGSGLFGSPWGWEMRGQTLLTICFPCIGILYVPWGAEVTCTSLLNTTLSSSSFEVYQCCRKAFQR